ncbi:MAG: SDR family oxidoreductase [Pseudomonadota bacterium]
MSQKDDAKTTLQGKIYFLTGASSGLGAHISGYLVGKGAYVVASARRRESLNRLPGVENGTCQPFELDVTDPEAVETAIRQALAWRGRLDGLINNAGVAWGGKALEMPATEWQRVIDTNLTGAFTVAQAAARAMAEGGGGAIVSTASILGFGTGQGVAAYAAAKAGLVHLTRCLALEWARHNIRVNAIAPGYIPTEINRAFLESPAGEEIRQVIPMRRFGRPEDLEGPLELLLSDAGAYITGAVIPVDGGHLCRAL